MSEAGKFETRARAMFKAAMNRRGLPCNPKELASMGGWQRNKNVIGNVWEFHIQYQHPDDTWSHAVFRRDAANPDKPRMGVRKAGVEARFL